MGLEDGDQFLICRYLFILKHSTNGLVDDLLNSGNESLQGIFQTLNWFLVIFTKCFQYLFGLGDTLLGDLDQFTVGLFAGFLLASDQPAYLTSCFPGTSGPVAKYFIG